jgi:hypothetical protein
MRGCEDACGEIELLSMLDRNLQPWSGAGICDS